MSLMGGRETLEAHACKQTPKDIITEEIGENLACQKPRRNYLQDTGLIHRTCLKDIGHAFDMMTYRIGHHEICDKIFKAGPVSNYCHRLPWGSSEIAGR